MTWTEPSLEANDGHFQSSASPYAGKTYPIDRHKYGGYQEMTAKEVQYILDGGVIVNHTEDHLITEYECPLCAKQVASLGGFGPHARKHREQVGLVEKRKATPKKKSNKLMDEAGDPPPTPSKPEKITVDEACLALIHGITGRKTVPLDRVADVAEWIAYTKEFLKEIK